MPNLHTVDTACAFEWLPSTTTKYDKWIIAKYAAYKRRLRSKQAAQLSSQAERAGSLRQRSKCPGQPPTGSPGDG